MARTTNYTALMAMAVAVGVAVGMVVLAASQSVEAAPKFKNVTKTFSNPPPILIPETDLVPTGAGPAEPYPSEISVAGFRRGKILDVNLTLENFSHRFPSDVDVLLVGPGVFERKNAIVMSDVGGLDVVNNVTLVLDDEAASPLPPTLPGDGTFKPTNGGIDIDFFPSPAPDASGASALSVFDTTNPNGVWELFVLDDSPSTHPEDFGRFADGWSLKIKARVVTPRK